MCIRERMHMFMSMALLPAEVFSAVSAAWNETGLLDDAKWSNVPSHCLKVAEVTNVLCRIAAVDVDHRVLAIAAALLHDVFKRREKAEDGRKQELVAHGMSELEAYNVIAAEQTEWLANFGPHMAEVARISGLAGHTSLGYFLGADRPMHEKAFHLADDLCGDPPGEEYRGDVVLMLVSRLEQVSKKYPWMNESDPQFGGQSKLDVQSRIAVDILHDFAVGYFYFDTAFALNQLLVRLLN